MKRSRQLKKKNALLFAMLSSALLLQLPLPAQAEENPAYDFSEVVVTATKTPQKAFSANANIAVLTRQQLEQNHFSTLAEALRSVSGVYISNYGAGGEGYTANQFRINGSTQVVVLIDGVRANTNGTTFGTFQPTEVNQLDNIERIEIVKGSASTLYGSDAKGGVINIITRKAAANKTTFTLTGGSYGTENYEFRNQGKSGDYSWSVSGKKDISGNYRDANGLEIPAHQNASSYDLKITKQLNEKSDITVDYEQYKSDYLRSNTNLHLDQRNYGSKDNDKLTVIYNYRFSDAAQNQLSLYSNRNRLSDKPGTTNAWLMDLETRGIQEQFTRKLGRHTYVAGFDFYQDKVNNYESGTVGAYGYTKYADKTISNRAFYLQDEWSMSPAWKLTYGIRQDNHSLSGNHTTPSITLGYAQDDDTNYYVGYKEFFVSPNQFQFFSPYGNLNLKPETGGTIEAGVNHNFSKTLTGSLHVFSRDTKDAIAYDSVTKKYINKNSEKANGWDIQLNKKWSEQFSSAVGYTYTNIEAAKGEIENLNGSLPRGLWNISLNYQRSRYDISLLGRGIIDKPGPKTATPAFPVSSYWIWDLAANYKLSADTKLFFKANNLFNQEYAEYSNVAWGQPGEWYPSAGRNYQFGMQFQF